MILPEGAGPQRRYFEVAIPAGSAEQYLAFDGLATAFGWPVREIGGPSERPGFKDISGESMLLEGDFAQTSSELWQTPYYGTFAVSYLEALRSAMHTHGRIVAFGGVVKVNAYGSVIPYRDFSVTIGNTKMLPEAILDSAKQALGEIPVPFEIDITQPDEQDRRVYDPYYKLEPLFCTRERLQRHLTHTGKDKHGFHGAIGKAIDTMLVAANMEPGAAREEPDEAEFISLSEFNAAMQLAGVRQTQLFTTLRNLDHTIVDQFASGESPKTGEIIIEGDCRYPSMYGNRKLIDRIALSSLESFVPHTATQMPNVGWALQNIREHYLAWKQTLGQ